MRIFCYLYLLPVSLNSYFFNKNLLSSKFVQYYKTLVYFLTLKYRNYFSNHLRNLKIRRLLFITYT